MAKVIIFPDQPSFERTLRVRELFGDTTEPLYPPQFCFGLVPPSIVVTGGINAVMEKLHSSGIPISGIIEHRPFKGDVPEAGPPDAVWREILGGLRINRLRPSLTDPLKIRLEADLLKETGSLIPIMARLIRGGAYRPHPPVLAIEEEHRLVAISPQGIVISRANDLMDMWIILRTTVELFITAWERRSSLEPETEARLGISAIEVFKRLPATNCGMCNNYSCMEFAAGLMTGRCRVEQCAPLFSGGDSRYVESLNWLMRAIGLAPGRP